MWMMMMALDGRQTTAAVPPNDADAVNDANAAVVAVTTAVAVEYRQCRSRRSPRPWPGFVQ